MPNIITDEPPKTPVIPEEILQEFTPEMLAAVEAMRRMSRVKNAREDYLIRSSESSDYILTK